MGWSPGDGSYDQPYFYVGPHSRPKPEDLPALTGAGRWRTEGFTAAILTGGDIVKGVDGNDGTEAESQYNLATGFLDAAISVSKKLLEKAE